MFLVIPESSLCPIKRAQDKEMKCVETLSELIVLLMQLMPDLVVKLLFVTSTICYSLLVITCKKKNLLKIY